MKPKHTELFDLCEILQGTFSVKFEVPDVYGIFKFVVDYKRLGYSYIELSKQVGTLLFFASFSL